MGPTFWLDRMIVYGKSAEYAEISSSSIPPSRGKGKRSTLNLHEPPYNPILVLIKCSRMDHFRNACLLLRRQANCSEPER